MSMNQKFHLQGIEIVVLGAESCQKSAERISGCERCSKFAVTALERLLDDVLLGRGTATAYLLGTSLVCPNCEAPILETTLVQLKESYRADCSENVFNWFELPLPETNIELIDETMIAEAQFLIAACESCGDNAQISFDYLLDVVTRCDPTATEYLMCRPAKCPRCSGDVTEKTLVIPA
jgi:hypothetical protein